MPVRIAVPTGGPGASAAARHVGRRDDPGRSSRSAAWPSQRFPLRRSARRQRSTGVRYLIAFAVTLASVLELVDTSIVNVAIPHMMGNLGATLDEIAWVSTGYIVANVIVLPITGWLSARFGRRQLLRRLDRPLHGRLVLLRQRAHARGAGVLAHHPGPRRRRADLDGAGDPVRRVPARGARHGHGDLRHGRDGRPDARPDPGRLDHRQLFAGPGSSTSTSRSASWRRTSPGRYVPEPRTRSQKDRGVDWLGLLFLIVGIGALQILLERGERRTGSTRREIDDRERRRRDRRSLRSSGTS